MLFEFLTSDEFLFWTMVAVQSALIIWFVEMGNALAAAVTLMTIFVGAAFFAGQWGHFEMLDTESDRIGGWLLGNAWRIVAGTGCYLLLGLLWATFRWWLFVNDVREAYDEQKRLWLLPRHLMSSAHRLEVRASMTASQSLRIQYQEWAAACRAAAETGGQHLSDELKPAWKEFVENGYRF
ncbi:MAG: hypothetical protein ACYTGL_03295 [Planctomycetota bacterium]|jgi:hypothetical protein